MQRVIEAPGIKTYIPSLKTRGWGYKKDGYIDSVLKFVGLLTILAIAYTIGLLI